MKFTCPSVVIVLCMALAKCKVNSVVEQELASKEFAQFLVQLHPPSVQSFNFNARSVTTEMVDAHGDEVVDELKQHSDGSQTGVMEYLEEMKNQGQVNYIKSYYISNTIAVEGTKQVIDHLKSLDIVEEISSNRPFKAKVASLDENESVLANNVGWAGDAPHWSLEFINATKLPFFVPFAASKLRYANADTGVQYDHPALAANYLGHKSRGVNHNYAWWDAVKNSRFNVSEQICPVDSQAPCDDSGHGTHTMSTTVGQLRLGVSPTTKWMACRNMEQGLGSPETYLSCLQFFLAPTNLEGTKPTPLMRPHVIGNSYGCPPDEGCSPTTFKYALRALRSAGIFMSVSAGNEGRGGCSTVGAPPAMDPLSFNVAAASYQSYQRASFSSLGPVEYRPSAIDVGAPGVNITGAYPGNRYVALQGTSMASPHVSGVALLIMAACPHLYRRVDVIAKVLRQSATPVLPKLSCGKDTPSSVPNNEMGWGVVNVQAALKLCAKTWF